MSRISPEARILLDRLNAMDPAHPRIDRVRIVSALNAHLAELGLPSRPVVWALDPISGNEIALRSGYDDSRDAAWNAARLASRRAVLASSRSGRFLVLALVLTALTAGLAAVLLIRPGVWIIPVAAYLLIWWSVVHAIRNGWGERSVASEIGVVVGSLLLPLLVVTTARANDDGALFGLTLASGLASTLAVVWARHLAVAVTAGLTIVRSATAALTRPRSIAIGLSTDDSRDDEQVIDAAWTVILLGFSLAALLVALRNGIATGAGPVLSLGTTAVGGVACWGLGRAALGLSGGARGQPAEAKQIAVADAWTAIGGDWVEHGNDWADWIVEPPLIVSIIRAVGRDGGWGDGWGDSRHENWGDDWSAAHLVGEAAVDAVGEVNCAVVSGQPGSESLAIIALPLVAAYEAGLFALWFCPGKMVCVLRPALSIVEGRLHDSFAPAVRWASGSGQWFRRGVHIPGWIATAPHRVTLETIQEESTEEIRRRMIEVFGPSRFLRETGAGLLHEDEFGRLWEAEFDDGEVWRVVEVENGTPEPDGSRRTYTLDVTGAEAELGWRIETARAAVAATYGLRPEQYRPEVRT